MALFLCIPTCVCCFYVSQQVSKHERFAKWFGIDEDDDTVLTAKDGTNERKYKSATCPQADLQVTISLGNVLALEGTRQETYRLEIMQEPGIYLLKSLYLNRIWKGAITEA